MCFSLSSSTKRKKKQFTSSELNFCQIWIYQNSLPQSLFVPAPEFIQQVTNPLHIQQIETIIALTLKNMVQKMIFWF